MFMLSSFLFFVYYRDLSLIQTMFFWTLLNFLNKNGLFGTSFQSVTCVTDASTGCTVTVTTARTDRRFVGTTIDFFDGTCSGSTTVSHNNLLTRHTVGCWCDGKLIKTSAGVLIFLSMLDVPVGHCLSAGETGTFTGHNGGSLTGSGGTTVGTCTLRTNRIEIKEHLNFIDATFATVIVIGNTRDTTHDCQRARCWNEFTVFDACVQRIGEKFRGCRIVKT